MDSNVVRLLIFLSIFIFMAVIESYFPARKAPINRATRWRGNLCMVVISAIVLKLFLPLGLVGVSLLADELNFGLFNTLELSPTITIVICIVLLDLIIYWQHRLFHLIPLLWRLHKVHHADSHIDTTTGLRFHPLEILLSLLVKALVVLMFGVPFIAVVIFEIVLNGCALFNHANIRLPKKLDKTLSFFIITQRLHRIHHSQYANETNANYGFSVSWWDRIFGSYCAKAKQLDEYLDIGLKEYPATKSNSQLITLLLMPFKKNKTGK